LRGWERTVNWKIEFLPEAKKDLYSLDNSVRKRILSAIAKLEKDPIKYGEPLGKKQGIDLVGLYKITPADGYRVIYLVQKKQITVIIISLGKREKGKAYKSAAQRIEEYRHLTNIELKKLSSLLEKK